MRKTRKIKKKGGWWWSRKSVPKLEVPKNEIVIEEKNEREEEKNEIETEEEKKLNSKIFIDTCKDIFMTEPLSMVSKISWMKKDDCNIFLIGEYAQFLLQHSYFTGIRFTQFIYPFFLVFVQFHTFTFYIFFNID